MTLEGRQASLWLGECGSSSLHSRQFAQMFSRPFCRSRILTTVMTCRAQPDVPRDGAHLVSRAPPGHRWKSPTATTLVGPAPRRYSKHPTNRRCIEMRCQLRSPTRSHCKPSALPKSKLTRGGWNGKLLNDQLPRNGVGSKDTPRCLCLAYVVDVVQQSPVPIHRSSLTHTIEPEHTVKVHVNDGSNQLLRPHRFSLLFESR